MFSGTDLCLLMSTVIDDERAYIKAETKIVEALNRAISKILKDFAKLHSNVNLSSIDAQFDIELPDELKKLSGITIKSIKGSFVHGRLDADARYHYDFARASAALGPAEAESEKFDPVLASVQNGTLDLTAVAAEKKQNTVCSVFAKPVVSTGATVLIQVFLHKKLQLLLAAREAQRLDPQCQRRAFKPLSIRLKHRQTVWAFGDAGVCAALLAGRPGHERADDAHREYGGAHAPSVDAHVHVRDLRSDVVRRRAPSVTRRQPIEW